MAVAGEKKEGAKGKSIQFHYIKSQSFRPILVDGMMASFHPNGTIHLAVFNERPAIPQKLTFKVDSDGSLGDEIAELRDSKEGFVREVEADLVLNIENARVLFNHIASVLNRVGQDQEGRE